MKNLTNAQLEILTEAFMERVALKVEERKQTQAYDDALEVVKKSKKYDKILPILEKRDKINKKIEKLNEEKEELRAEYDKLSKEYSYHPPSVSGFKKDIEKEVIKELAKDLPTKREVKAQIVLMSIKKSDDILKDLGNKFDLKDEEDEPEA